MFRTLAGVVSRFWPFLLAGWLGMVALTTAVAPSWKSVVDDGEFAFLPENAPSRRGEELFQSAFGRKESGEHASENDKDLVGSSIVIVVRREGHRDGLLPRDRDFIENVLAPRIERIAEEEGGLAGSAGSGEGRSVIAEVKTFSDKDIGPLLESEDGKASLVIVDLTTEFLENRNRRTIEKIEHLIARDGRLRQERLVPVGLDLAISGLAVVGRDMRLAADESASATETATVLLVVVLLLVIYRAPVLAFIPLSTVAVAVHIALKLLAILAAQGMVELFAGIEVYVTVVLYGAGVDYCLFLISRYKEHLDGGATFDEAVRSAIGRVGAALVASAGTVMCGIGMMVFADFGKFQQAGVAMSLSLLIVLAAALTFTPSLLRLAGRWAFWPKMATERISSAAGWISATSAMARLLETVRFRGVWEAIGRRLKARPATIWLASIALMLPFACIAVAWYDFLSYGLLSELPETAPSRMGTGAVQAHFPAGATGPVTILLRSPQVDFRTEKGIEAVGEFTGRLNDRRDELQLADIRSVAEPLGHDAPLRLRILSRSRRNRERAVSYYVAEDGELAGQVTRVDCVFEDDPFSRNSIAQLERFQQAVADVLPAELAQGADLWYVGATPSIRDLKTVTDADQIRIDVLVIAGVFLILVALLRRPAISAYLIVSVFFSFLVTLGVTFVVFKCLDWNGFAGLDWKVPMFLFTILIAVGEDYNIFLMTRLQEEQERYGPIEGITQALSKTGSIISSCGFIMAGTFSSLLVGSLAGMHQLGFALAFGVLLDTFVVRTVLVPAYLVLLYSGRFGALGRFLGARDPLARVEKPRPVEVGPES